MTSDPERFVRVCLQHRAPVEPVYRRCRQAETLVCPQGCEVRSWLVMDCEKGCVCGVAHAEIGGVVFLSPDELQQARRQAFRGMREAGTLALLARERVVGPLREVALESCPDRLDAIRWDAEERAWQALLSMLRSVAGAS